MEVGDAQLIGIQKDLIARARRMNRIVITATQMLESMIVGEHERDPEAIAAALGFEAMDTSELETMVEAAIADQPDAWAKFCAGEGKAMGALVGAVMKASKGQADGKAVTAMLNSLRGTPERGVRAVSRFHFSA